MALSKALKLAARTAASRTRIGYVAALGIACIASTISMSPPAAAACLIGNTMRNDIAAKDCREAQATGCIFHSLSPDQYADCRSKQPAEHGCIIGTTARMDIASRDCQEAQVTGCVFHNLSARQYASCRAAQP